MLIVIKKNQIINIYEWSLVWFDFEKKSKIQIE